MVCKSPDKRLVVQGENALLLVLSTELDHK